jgi:spore maturation protein CgeB
MEILIYGWDHDWTIGGSSAHALEEMGHDVYFFDREGSIFDSIPIVSPEKRRLERFKQKAERIDPDLVLVIKGIKLEGEFINSLAQRTDAVVANWYPDNPFMHRSEKVRASNYLDALSAYDIAFIWGEHLFDRLRDEGADDVRLLPFAFDPRIHHPTAPKSEYEAEVIFLAHWSNKRQRIVEPLTEFDLALYGDKWFRKNLLNGEIRSHIEGAPLRGEAYSAAMSSADLVLNVVGDHAGPEHNMRTFEIPATGRPMLTNQTEGQERFFTDGEEAIMYSDREDLVELVDYYLDAEDEREEIAERGHEAVQDHTYADRMQTVLDAAREYL